MTYRVGSSLMHLELHNIYCNQTAPSLLKYEKMPKKLIRIRKSIYVSLNLEHGGEYYGMVQLSCQLFRLREEGHSKLVGEIKKTQYGMRMYVRFVVSDYY